MYKPGNMFEPQALPTLVTVLPFLFFLTLLNVTTEELLNY